MKRFLPVLAVLLLVAAALPAAAQQQTAANLWPNAAADYQREVTAARKAGIPLSLRALQKPSPPAARDAAPLYVRIARIREQRPLSQADDEALSALLHTPVPSPAVVTEARKVLARRTDLLNLARQVATRPECVFVYDMAIPNPVDIRLPEFSALRLAGRLMAADAVVFAQDKKDTAAGVEAVRRATMGFQVSRHAASGILMLGPLTAYGIDSVTLDGLQNILYTHGANPEVTQAIQSAVTKRWRSHSLAPALRSEIAFHMDYVAFLRRTGPTGLKEVDPSLDKIVIPPGAPWETFLDANAAYLLNGLPSLIAAADKPYPSAYPLFKVREDELDATDTADLSQSTGRTLALIMSPQGTTGLLRRAEVAAQADALVTAAALLAYRHAHSGAFPATLAAAGISPLPVDPFNGKPLQYQRESSGAGFVLSSVGSGEPRRPAPSLRYPPTP